MSTFNGLIDEIPFISVDRFEKHNLNSSIFFLSHCHSDHMIGLHKELILPGSIYCSEISAIFLKKQFPNLELNIEILELEVSSILFNPKNVDQKVVVTCLPALHCPGSVMFIFETDKEKILYTGDFRYCKKTLVKYPILNYTKFDKIFLDSTFLSEHYHNFPTQNDSVKIICKLTKSWIDKGPEYKVVIETPAQYGYEYIMIQLFASLKILIFIEEKQIEKYIYFPDMDKFLTNDISCASVIFRQKNYFKKSTSSDIENKTFKYRILKPTAIFWKNWEFRKPIHCDTGNETFRIAFSNHSSLSEIKDFLLYTKPKEVKLNVIPSDNIQREKMEFVLCKILNEFDFHPVLELDKNTNQCYSFQNHNLSQNSVASKNNITCKLPPKRLKFT